VRHVIGGSAVYFSWAAAAFTKVRLWRWWERISAEFERALPTQTSTRPDSSAARQQTFRWKGTYDPTMNRPRRSVDLNVLIEAPPRVPAQFQDSKVVFLAATHPICNSICWVSVNHPAHDCRHPRPVIKHITPNRSAAYKHFDGIVLNDSTRLLTAKLNLVTASRVQTLVKPTGPRIVLLKKGEHGCWRQSAMS